MCEVFLKPQEILWNSRFLSIDGEEYEVAIGMRRNGCNKVVYPVAVYSYDFVLVDCRGEGDSSELILKRWVGIPTADGKYFYSKEGAIKYAKEIKSNIQGKSFINFLKGFIA